MRLSSHSQSNMSKKQRGRWWNVWRVKNPVFSWVTEATAVSISLNILTEFQTLIICYGLRRISGKSWETSQCQNGTLISNCILGLHRPMKTKKHSPMAKPSGFLDMVRTKNASRLYGILKHHMMWKSELYVFNLIQANTKPLQHR